MRSPPTAAERVAVLKFLRTHPDATLEVVAKLRDSRLGAALESLTLDDLIADVEPHADR